MQKDIDGTYYTYLNFRNENDGLKVKREVEKLPYVFSTVYYIEDGVWNLGIKFYGEFKGEFNVHY